MRQDVENYRKLKAHLKRIGDRNNDEFQTTVTWDEPGYKLEIIETADHHSFLVITGATIFSVVDRAEANLSEVCKLLGYEYVK